MERDLFRLDEINWRGLCIDLLRNGWMILLAAVTVWMAVGGVHNLIYRPQYTASSTLVVTVGGQSNAYSSLSTASQMADVFGQVFQSEALRQRIVEDVGEEIDGEISCQPIEETNLLVLSATCPDPRQAYIFINSALEHYESVAGDVFSNASLEVVQEPEVPSSPSNTSWVMSHRYMLVLLGAAGMTAVICLLYLLRFTVKNETGASRQLDGKILGVIPFERKNSAGGRKKNPKQSLLLNSPLVSMDFVEAERSVQAAVEYHMRRHHQKVLLVTSVTENEGKSTVAANIALALAEKRRKVLLVDGDLRRPALRKVFEVKRKGRASFEQVIKGEALWNKAVSFSGRERIWQMFQFRPAADPVNVIHRAVQSDLFGQWREQFDYIIVDSSPTTASIDAEIWMETADSVLLVVREDWADVRVINDTVDIIWQSGTDFAGFVLNGFHRSGFGGVREYGYSNYRKAEKTVLKRG